LRSLRWVAVLVAALTLSVACGGAGYGAKPASSSGPSVSLKLGYETPSGTPYDLGAKEFARLLAKIDPSISVTLYPNSQLGSAQSMVDGVRLGTIDLLVTGNPQLVEPEGSIFALPFLFPNRPDLYKVLDGPVAKKIFSQSDGQGIHTLFPLWEGGFRDIMTVKPVNSIADLKGLKIRVPPDPGYVATFKALGANPTPVAFAQVYTALQQHVVDGVENSPAVMLSSKYAEVVKNLAVTNHIVAVATFVISEKAYKALTATQRANIEKAAAMAGQYERQQSALLEASGLKQIESGGVTITHPDLAPFVAAVKPVYATAVSTYPDDMAAILKALGQ